MEDTIYVIHSCEPDALIKLDAAHNARNAEEQSVSSLSPLLVVYDNCLIVSKPNVTQPSMQL